MPEKKLTVRDFDTMSLEDLEQALAELYYPDKREELAPEPVFVNDEDEYVTYLLTRVELGEHNQIIIHVRKQP